jgi:hypothetical protein
MGSLRMGPREVPGPPPQCEQSSIYANRGVAISINPSHLGFRVGLRLASFGLLLVRAGSVWAPVGLPLTPPFHRFQDV